MDSKPDKLPEGLAEKWLNGTLTTEEEEIFNQWYEAHNDGDIVVEAESREAIRNQMLATIKGARMESPMQGNRGKNALRKWLLPLSAAAAVVIIVVGLFNYPRYSDRKAGKVTKIQTAAIQQIVPGGNKAVLTLDNGQSILLDDAKSGLLANQGDVKILKTAAGIVVYTPDSQNNRKGATVSYNTISTPRGGQFQLELPDGTKVWLNAASSLRYPVHFGAGDRRVVLSGEAYFEVAKDAAHPFKVSIGTNTEVKVLGTHFDVMAYPDEAVSQTTLLEGSVQVSEGTTTRMIVPGEQAIIGSAISVKKVDVTEIIGWKNGMFNFTHEKLPEVMRKIARWYDVDLVYEGKLTNLSFVGTLPRSQNIKEILDYLELTGLVHFKINGRRIVIMP